MQKREDSGITHRKYHQTDKKGVANGPTSPTFSVRPMSFGRFKGEKRISSGSSSNSVFENTTQVIPSLASVKDVIDRLKKEVDSERIKRVSIAKQRSEDLLKLVLRSKNDQRPNEPKARRRLKDWHRIDFKNGCSKRSRLCNASADNLFAFISEPHLPTANSQPDIHRSFEDQSDTVQLLAGNLSGKPLDKEGKDDIFHRGKFGSLAFLEKLVKTSANCFEPTENKCTSHLTLQQPTVLESTVAAQEREVSLLKQQAEAEKSKNNLLVEQIRRLLEERTILVLQNTELVSRSRALQQINADQRYLDKVLSRIESIVGQAKTENLTLQSQMDRVLQDLGSPNGEESVETLRAKLRELEKRCALQQLRHEEVLLELEDVRKRTRQELGTYAHSAETGVSLDSVYRSTTDLVAPYLQNTLTNNNVLPVAEGRLYSGVMETGITVSGTALSTPLSTQMQIRGRLFGNSIAAVNKYPSMPERTEGKDPNLVELFQTADGLPEKNDIPSPRMITLERQLIHSVLISWKPPDYSSTGHSVSAYHVYVDGQFRLSVKAKEKTRALIDKVDADKPHRISVRAICTKGQSKDAQCTLVVGKGMTATPGRLRATQIGTKSAKLSWIPGNSNFWHRVYLNQYEIHTCPPGVYKILLTDLTPDTLHRVCVQAVPQSAGIPEPQESPPIWINNIRSGVDTKNLAAFIEFRTLPIGLPDPPTHVQLEPGPQDDMLLVTWVPVPQDARAAADAKAAGATSTLPVQGYTVCLNDQVIEEVDGASNDHAILSLKHLKDHLERTLGLFQSPPFHGALNYPSSENYPDIPTQFYSPPADDHSQPLFITVHSTVPASSVGQGIDLVDAVSNGSRGKNFDILKGSGGPGSLPVCLTPEILVACAGSLEAAVRVFGERLSQQLGINEQSATRAGVPLRLTVEGPSSPAPTTQSDHTTGMEAGLVTVSADASARKPNPTADAIGSAEYRSQPSSSVMTSVPEIRVQPDPARHGPTRPSRSRYMNNYTPSEDHRRVTSQAPTGPPSNEFRQARASSPAINPMTSGSRYASVIRNPSAQTLDLTASRHPGVYSSNAVRPRPGLPVDATGEYVSSRGKTQPTQMPQSRQTQSPPQVMAQTKGFHQSVGKGLTMLPGESGPHQPVNDTRPMRMVIALYDYDPAIMSPNPDAAQEELPFREGQVIKIFGECDEDGFFWGECNGLRGLVPSNMVSKPDREPNTEPAAPRTDRQIAYDRRYANATESTALPPGQLTRPRASEQTQRPLNPPLSHYESARKFGPPSYADTRKPGPPPPNEPMVQISSAYESRLLARPSHPSEIGSSNLNVREYDDTQRPGGYSRPPTNTSSLTDYPDTGQRPHNYRRQPGTEAMSMSTPVISERISQAPIARCMVAIYDYDPQLLSPNADAEMELSFQTGDQITVYGEMDEDGFYSGELADGRRGLVPSNFLRELPGGSERQVQRSLMIRDNRNRVSQRSLEPNEKGSGNSERAQNHAKETNQQYLLSAPQAENYTEDQRLQNKPMPSTNLPRVSSNVQKDSDIPYRAGNNQDGEQRPLHYPLGRNSFQRE